MTVSKFRDMGAYLTYGGHVATTSVTAGGSGDNTAINGPWIDRIGFNSCKIFVFGVTSIQAAQALALSAKLQDAVDGSGSGSGDFAAGMPNYSPLTAKQVIAGPTAAAKFCVELDFDLSGAKRFFRPVITPDLSAANTDTAGVEILIVLGGADKDVVTKRVN